MTTRTTKGAAGIPALLLIFSLFVAIGTGVAAAAPSVSVDPVSTTGYCPTDTFFVTVEADSDAHNLQMLKSDLVYNPAVFEVLGVTDDGLLGTMGTDYLVAPGSGDDGAGRIHYGVSKIGTATSPANGDFITVEFRIKTGAPDGTYPLDLQDTEMKDEGFNVVLNTGTDGNVVLACDVGTAPTVKVAPVQTTGCPGDIFFVTVEANSDTHNLQMLKSDLVYNPAVFEVLGVTDDGLLGTMGTDYLVAPGSGDDGAGRIHYGVSKIGTATSPANGDFITVEFQIKTGAPDGTYPLDLQNVEMKDEGFNVVLNTGTDGTVIVAPTTTYYQDADGDNYGNPAVSQDACAQPSGYVTDNTDCDDNDAAVNPGATEICNSIDDDCDTLVDDADPDCVGMTTYYQDADGDNYGNPAVSQDACAAPAGYVTDNTDCDDTNVAVNPGATEICNGIDDDCDNLVDDADPGCVGMTTYYQDADVDGYGNPAVSQDACAQPTGYVTDNTDCDDTNGAVNPGATEICNGIDDDCDNLVDEGFTMNTYYGDADGDGYGDIANTTEACAAPPGYVEDSTDCDDTNAAVNPGATEVCNGIDDDCDTLVDEDVMTTYYGDADGDGYGDPANTTEACAAPAGYVEDNTDCDDTNAAVNPGAAEVPDDGIDNNCNGVVDEDFCLDLDAGWNLVSVPEMVASSNDAETVFNIGDHDLCEYYDACASPPRWLNLNEITVDPTRGYLVSKTNPEMLCLNFNDGALFPSAQPVCVGDFNMIGFPSMDGMSVNDFETATILEFSMMMQWNGGYGNIYPSGYMTPGRGYLIWPTADGSMPGMI